MAIIPAALGKMHSRLRDFRKGFRWNLSRRYTRSTGAELPASRRTGRPRVAWVLWGDDWVGSARLKGLLIDHQAKKTDCGFDSAVAYMPDGWDPCLRWSPRRWGPVLERADVVVIQTRTGSTQHLMDDCRRRGVAAVFSLSDMDFSELPEGLLSRASALVVSSEPLLAAGRVMHGNAVLIDDPLEVPEGCVRAADVAGANPELVWLGHENNWPALMWLKTVLAGEEFATLKWRTVTSHAKGTHRWSPGTAWHDVSQSDVAVIPCILDAYGLAKSSNRLVSFMAMGYPVICSPIPSYTRLIQDGQNGFLATTPDDWRRAIRLLRDPELRTRIGEAARRTGALEGFRIDEVAGKWKNLFDSLC